MKRLIDADKIMDELMDYADIKCANGYMDTANGILSAVNYIRNNVTRVDAVPVVRCRDCKHWKPSGSKAGNSFSDMEYIGGCEFTNYCRRESDFCSYGERKDNCGTRLEDVKK